MTFGKLHVDLLADGPSNTGINTMWGPVVSADGAGNSAGYFCDSGTGNFVRG